MTSHTVIVLISTLYLFLLRDIRGEKMGLGMGKTLGNSSSAFSGRCFRHLVVVGGLGSL